MIKTPAVACVAQQILRLWGQITREVYLVVKLSKRVGICETTWHKVGGQSRYQE